MESEGTTDRQAFFEFFREEFVPLTLFARAMGASDDAEDAVSETMMALLKHWNSVMYPKAWARSVIVNHITRNAQKRNRETAVLPENLDLQPYEDPGFSEIEVQRSILGAIRSLPERQKQVLMLAMDSYTPAETAALLGVTPASVRNALFHARRTLKSELHADTTDE